MSNDPTVSTPEEEEFWRRAVSQQMPTPFDESVPHQLRRIERKVDACLQLLWLLVNKDDGLANLAAQLKAGTDALSSVIANNPVPSQHRFQGEMSMNPLDVLTQQVAATVGVEASAGKLAQGLGDYIRANATNPAAMLALAKQLSDSATALGAAIAANPVPSP